MAHVHTFGTVAPSAAGIIQYVYSHFMVMAPSLTESVRSLGATSCYVTECV